MRTRGPRRQLQWARRHLAPTTITDTAVSFELLTDYQDAKGTTGTAATVRRLVMQFDAVAMGGPMIAGVIVVPPAVGAPSLVGPMSQHADWMWYQRFFPNVIVDAGYWTVDIKSGRKIDEIGEELRIVLQMFNAATTADVGFTTSVLLALP